MVHHDLTERLQTPAAGILDMLPADMMLGLVQAQLASVDPAALAATAADAYLAWSRDHQLARGGGLFQGTIGIRIVEGLPNGAATVGDTIKTPDAVQGVVLGVLAALGVDVTPDLFPSAGAMDAAASLTGYQASDPDADDAEYGWAR